MDMEQALLARCEEDTELRALIARRVHWEERPAGQGHPSIVLQVVSAPRDQHMKGFQCLKRTRVQALIFAESYAAKKAVTEALIGCLVPAGTFHGIKFRRAMIAADADRPAGASETTTVLCRQVDFIIWHSPA